MLLYNAIKLYNAYTSFTMSKAIASNEISALVNTGNIIMEDLYVKKEASKLSYS